MATNGTFPLSDIVPQVKVLYDKRKSDDNAGDENLPTTVTKKDVMTDLKQIRKIFNNHRRNWWEHISEYNWNGKVRGNKIVKKMQTTITQFWW